MKKKTKHSNWVNVLRSLMDKNGYNPRSLSIKAGLNATAVRDILEGRAKHPRYDTIKSLSDILNVTPDELMDNNDKKTKDDDLDILTGIIEELQKTANEYKQQIKPKNFAAMVTTIYALSKDNKKAIKKAKLLNPINQLMTYERLRKK